MSKHTEYKVVLSQREFTQAIGDWLKNAGYPCEKGKHLISIEKGWNEYTVTVISK